MPRRPATIPKTVRRRIDDVLLLYAAAYHRYAWVIVRDILVPRKQQATVGSK
jgi:hypothetical protein